MRLLAKTFAALSLVSTLSAALASAETQRFSQPPPRAAARVAPIDRDEPSPVIVDRDSVRAALAASRARNLDTFRAYQQAGVFPSNTYVDGAKNVWRDDAGHFCAAATILRASGGTALSDKVAEQTNFIRLGDVKQGPLMDWILTSGFTQDEIAAIQEPFMRVGDREMIDQRKRAMETARLRAKYKTVEAAIVKNEKASLELAVTRVMKNEALAYQLVADSGT